MNNGTCIIYCHVTDTNVTEYYANCTYRNLEDVPQNLTPNITFLNMAGNNIASINGSSFQRYTSLRKLSLAKNTIARLDDSDFVHIPHLEMLDLSLNHIRYINISEDVFKSLYGLTYLDIKQDLPDIWLNETYPSALRHLLNLQTLMIDGLNSTWHSKMINVTDLYISGEYGRCDIAKINGTIFDRPGVVGIQNLSLSSCSIRAIANGTFTPVPYLESLDISRNTELCMESLPNITSGLTVIKRLNVNSLVDYVDYDYCTSLREEDFKYLFNTKLELLLMEKNNIVRMDEATVKVFPSSLKYLSIRDNKFMYGKYIDRIIQYKLLYHLVYFDTSQMYKTHIPVNTISSSQRRDCMHKLYIQTESVNGNTCVQPVSTDEFNALANSMFTRKQIVDDFDQIWARMKKHHIGLTQRSISGEQKSSCGSEHGLNYSKLEYLDLSENLPGTIKMALAVLNITQCMKFLNVSNNYLGYPFLDEKKCKMFHYLQQLHTLDISNNRITQLTPAIFKTLTHLRNLYLSNNRLTDISFLSPLHRLAHLDLRENNLEKLSTSSMNTLDKQTNITIYISNNNWKCICENIAFIKWFERNTKKFKDLGTSNCTFENLSTIYFSDFNYNQFYLKCSPPDYQVLILVTSLCLLAFIIILSCGLVYRFKWNLRYLYYMTKFMISGRYQPIDDSDFEKDVFVSYANEDRDFVVQHVLPELEDNGNDISLLVHERDFDLGEYIADNIVQAITSTRRTLVILTRAYIASKWCMYEMNMARMEAADTGRNVLCVILKENISVQFLPLEIVDIIRRKTYMEYPREEEHMDIFWDRLRETLKHQV